MGKIYPWHVLPMHPQRHPRLNHRLLLPSIPHVLYPSSSSPFVVPQTVEPDTGPDAFRTAHSRRVDHRTVSHAEHPDCSCRAVRHCLDLMTGMLHMKVERVADPIGSGPWLAQGNTIAGCWGPIGLSILVLHLADRRVGRTGQQHGCRRVAVADRKRVDRIATAVHTEVAAHGEAAGHNLMVRHKLPWFLP